MTSGPVCPYCNSAAVLRDSSIVYGRSYGSMWICPAYPRCDAYVGCHPGSTRPLGRLADRELREAKKRAHAAFDPLWRQGGMKRGEAYRELSRRLGVREAHIGESDLATCARIVELSVEMRWEAEQRGE